MTIFGFELKRNRISLIIWCAVIASMIAISILLFPLMEKTMTEMTELLANMGGLSAAYGMDQLSIGDYLNYYAMECSEILGLGGGLFAALTAIAALSKEEREQLVKGENFASFFASDVFAEDYPYYSSHPDELEKVQDRFVGLTEGFSFTEINGLRRLCKNEKTRIRQMSSVIDLYRYGIKENPWDSLDVK